MQVSKRTITYSSLVVAMAILLSAALMQLTYADVQSANLRQIDAQAYTLTITKTVEGGTPATDWEFTIEGIGVLSTVNVPAIGGSTAISVPSGIYSITETVKDGYWLASSSCPIRPDAAAPTAIGALNPVVAYVEGEDVTCQFVNSELATVTVIKDSIPDSSQPFTFTVNVFPTYNPTPLQFQLYDDGTGIGNTYVISDAMASHTYYINEHHVDGWAPIGLQCVDKDGPIITPNTAAQAQDLPIKVMLPPVLSAWVPVEAGEQYTCTFTNAAPVIELVKTVGAEPGVCATSDEITVFPGTEVHYCYEVTNTGGLTMTKHTLDDDQMGNIFTDLSHDLIPGAAVDSLQAGYTVSDTLSVTTKNVATWTATMTYTPMISVGAGADLDIDAAAPIDGVVQLTLTAVSMDMALVNVVEPSKVIIDKVTLPSGSTQEFTFAFGQLSSPPQQIILTDQATPWESPDLFPGSYAVSEVSYPDGWQSASIVCTDDAGAQYEPAGFDLPEGVTVTCVFTNEQLGRVIIDKVTVPSGSTQAFDFALTGPSVTDNFSLTDAATPYDSGYLSPGSYSVSETPVTDWTTTSSCDDGSPVDDINLLPGSTITCTFTNTSSPTALDDDDLPKQMIFLPHIGSGQ